MSIKADPDRACPHEVLRDDELVAGAVVLMKVIEGDGTVRVSHLHSDGLGWVERLGMLRAALITEESFIRDHKSSDSE